MPKKITVYDKQTGEAFEQFAVDAHESVRNDPARYRLSPWKGQVGSKAAKAKAAAAEEGDEDEPRVGPSTSRTSSGPVKAVPVGREDTGAREPENPHPDVPQGRDPAVEQDKADAAAVAEADADAPAKPAPSRSTGRHK